MSNWDVLELNVCYGSSVTFVDTRNNDVQLTMDTKNHKALFSYSFRNKAGRIFDTLESGVEWETALETLGTSQGELDRMLAEYADSLSED